MKRILLIGRKGQLGWELHRALLTLGTITALDFPEIDLRSPDSYTRIIREISPEIIVNAAAFTAVDQAESEQEMAWKINAIAPGVMADEARRLNAQFIHYSTDYVFDGTKGIAYTEDDTPNPLNHYGKSKLEGERLIQDAGGMFIILRTSWLYSLRQAGGFVYKILQWARQQKKMMVVDDQISNPTWARFLAEATSHLLALDSDYLQEHRGLYHVAGDGSTSRLDWAKVILELDPARHEQVVQEILPARTADFSTMANRPLYSAITCDRFQREFGIFIPAWQDSLKLAMEEGHG